MSTIEDQTCYVKDILLNKISLKFPDEKIVNHELIHSDQLDGFMSTLFLLDIKTLDLKTNEEKFHKLIVKFMKSDVEFRKASKSYEQFANEIFIYDKLLPYYEKLAGKTLAEATKSKSLSSPPTKIPKKSDEITIDEKDQKLSINVGNWTPRTIYAEYGLIKGLSDGKSNESILVLENIQPLGYRSGPRCFLDRHHLLLSIKVLAEYHAFTYAMRIKKDPMLQKFIDEIVPLPFVSENSASSVVDKVTVTTTVDDVVTDVVAADGGNKSENNLKILNAGNGNSLYDVLYKIAFERFFLFVEKLKKIKINKVDSSNTISNDADIDDDLLEFILQKLTIGDDFFDSLEAFKAKWYHKPTELLEFIRCNCIKKEMNGDGDDIEDVFPLILHGDFNRNNLLYKYNDPEGFENPTAVKMIDFQELRYGTPAIDLSFHMYMNMEPSIRNEFWLELLEFYHVNMINTLATILNVNIDDESLNPYRFDKFNEHFTKYAFYGAIVSMHFLPWMTCSKEEVEKLSHLFATDMHGNDFHKISLEAGGYETDKLIAEIVQHAIKMGYMKYLL